MSRFDAILALDWSGAKGRYDGIALAEIRGQEEGPRLIAPKDNGRWTRTVTAAYLLDRIGAGERLLITVDCAFSMPFLQGEGYLQGRVPDIEDALSLWAFLDGAAAGAADFHLGPMLDHPVLAPSYWTKGKQPPGWKGEKRVAETACANATQTRPETVFKLIGSKQVGKASLTGMRVIHHMRMREPDRLSVWPFEEREPPSVMAEIYPTLFRRKALGGLAKIRDRAGLDNALGELASGPAQGLTEGVTDHAADALITAAGLRQFLADTPAPFALPSSDLDRIRREGWIAGVPGDRP